jgi:NIPSNAP
MPTLCIRYKIDPNKLPDFEEYARNWPKPIERCGGRLIGYFLPTKLAGRTDFALALIDFPNLTAYEEYRRRLMEDPEVRQNVANAERSGCILLEDRSFLRWVET